LNLFFLADTQKISTQGDQRRKLLVNPNPSEVFEEEVVSSMYLGLQFHLFSWSGSSVNTVLMWVCAAVS